MARPWATPAEAFATELTCEMVSAETQTSRQIKTNSFLFISPPQNEKRPRRTLQHTYPAPTAPEIPVKDVKGSNKLTVSRAEVCSQPYVEIKNFERQTPSNPCS